METTFSSNCTIESTGFLTLTGEDHSLHIRISRLFVSSDVIKLSFNTSLKFEFLVNGYQGPTGILGQPYWVIIEFPSNPTIVYEISLKTSFEEYLYLIASILSLWFGFSIIRLTGCGGSWWFI